MKIVNVMNFIRQCEPRIASADKMLFPTTQAQIEMVKKYGVENTFLLQYDTLCDPKYVELFQREKDERMEIGLWYEIVEPMTSAVGLPYRSEFGWAWDYHIVPGFSMGYTQEERRMLIDEAMNKFKSVFGYYPKTVASWVIDTYTVNYLADHYDISAMGICRDQMNVDAYTLHGGYFNQAYYPSRKNMFTPAQSDELRVKVPMFRLLGTNPITNYDGRKYKSEEHAKTWDYTLEPAWKILPEIVDWFYQTYYRSEDMGFSYSQIGQENSFSEHNIVPQISMEIEKALELGDVKFMKMCDTGEWFKEQYPNETPVTAVTALENWDSTDVQSVYYDSQYYVGNIFRHEQKVFIRALYKFDETVEDKYMNTVCDVDYAVYENLPIVDTRIWDDGKKPCGMYLDYQGEPFRTERISEKELKILWADKYVLFQERGLTIRNCNVEFYKGNAKADIKVSQNQMVYSYLGTTYELHLSKGRAVEEGEVIRFLPEENEISLDIQ